MAFERLLPVFAGLLVSAGLGSDTEGRCTCRCGVSSRRSGTVDRADVRGRSAANAGEGVAVGCCDAGTCTTTVDCD